MPNLVSNCCGANPWLNNINLERCGDCLENCEFINEDEL